MVTQYGSDMNQGSKTIEFLERERCFRKNPRTGGTFVKKSLDGSDILKQHAYKTCGNLTKKHQTTGSETLLAK